MKKIICLVSEEYPEETNFGGIATYNKQMATLLKESGYRVIVLTRSLGEKKEYEDNGVMVIRIKSYFKKIKLLEKLIGYRLAVLNNINKVIKKYNIDIIESPDWKGELFFYFLLNKHKKIPTIIRLHGCRAIIRKYDLNKLNFGDKIVIAMEKYILNKSKYISSSSFENLKETESVLNINLENKVEVIHNFLDKSIKQVKIKKGNKRIILFVGRLDYLKGIFSIIKIAPSICEKFEDVIFEFVGKDSYNSQKNEYNSKLMMDMIPNIYKNRIKIIGSVSKEEVSKFYANAYVTIIPSYYESFSYTCIESMYQGTPVIGSDNGGIKEIIDDKKDGLLIDANNINELYQGLDFILSNENIRNSMAQLAVKKVEKQFISDAIRDNIDRYFNSIIEEI